MANRTINERKALRGISLSLIGNYVSLYLMFGGLLNSLYVLFGIGIAAYFITLMFLFWHTYSLGWEYKRCEVRDSELNDALKNK